MTRMATGDVRKVYPVGAAAAASSGAPASSVPTSTALPAPAAGRYTCASTGANRILRWRAARTWARWTPFGLRACPCLGPDPDLSACPYGSAAACGFRRRWAARAVDGVRRVCGREREVLLDVADSLTASGFPGPLSMIAASALLRGHRDGGDARLLDSVLRQVGSVSIELVRASARRAAAGKAEDGLDGYMQLLAGAAAPGTGGGNGGA